MLGEAFHLMSETVATEEKSALPSAKAFLGVAVVSL